MPEQLKRIPNTVCFVCKKPIYRRPSQIESGRVFCSWKCSGVASRKEVPCSVCGKSILSGLNKKTCSRACANKNRSGIKYKIGRPRDKATTARAIKQKLLKIRGGRCERCGYSIREVLQIHHINRKHSDNRLENLEVICPNCHYEEHILGGKN